MKILLAAFVITLFLSCGQTGRISSAPQKITVTKDQVYDLAGYADEGKGDPFDLFDENAYADPRADSKVNGASDLYIPVTDPQPRFAKENYFPVGKGSRIVTDLLAPYKLSEVYLYDRSHSEDSVWIYTGTMKNWKQRAAFTTKGDASQWGWRRFALGDSAQYVMIRFSSFETKITEMVLYGTPYGRPLPASSSPRATSSPSQPTQTSSQSAPGSSLQSPAVSVAPRLTRNTISRFLGANYFVEQEPQWIKPFYYNRVYTFTAYFDDDTVHAYPNNRYDLRHFGYWNTGQQKYSFFMDTLRRADGAVTWYSVRGPSLWMGKKGFTDKDRPVTLPGMDPEDPRSYARHANMMWHLAAFFGNTAVDTNLLSLSHSPRRSGLGLLSLYENGNEEDAWWVGNKYCSPLEYFAQSSADYDGAEGLLGERAGIKNADRGSALMTSGMIELDTNRLRVYGFLCKTLRKDKAFLWTGGIQYHHYSTNGKSGITPEEDSLRWKLARTRACTERVAPGVQCILGENGYDKGRDSRQAAPILPGYSAAQSQGVLILRSINATAFSGFDRYVLYWLRDFDDENDPRVYLTSGVLCVFSKDSVKYYPGWYYINTFVNRLADYVPDTVLVEKGDVWVYRYKRIAPSSDASSSMAYFVYCPTRNGTEAKNYSLRVGNPNTDIAEIIDFSDNSLTGQSVQIPVVDGTVVLAVGEKPRLVIVKAK